MKKLVLSAITIFAFVLSNAQTQGQSKSSKAQFGIKGGLNIANLNFSGTGAPSTKAVPNLNIGTFVEIGINDKWAFQPELIYSMQGAKFQLIYVEGSTVYDTRNTFKLHYLNIPLMMKYAENKIFFEAGPQIGFLMSAKLKTEVEGFGSDEQDAKEIFKKIDLGLGFGLGYNFTQQLSANFRYNFGLTNIAETESDDEKVKNSVIVLSVAYKFK
jgi:opacity protein-like surface antigen